MHSITSTPRPLRPLRRVRALVLVLATLVGGVALGLGLSPSSAHTTPTQRLNGMTIVDIQGDAADGFLIHRLNGGIDHTETRSEALAECSGYATARARARCQGHLTTWYADLGTMQQTIRYYQRLFD